MKDGTVPAILVRETRAAAQFSRCRIPPKVGGGRDAEYTIYLCELPKNATGRDNTTVGQGAFLGFPPLPESCASRRRRKYWWMPTFPGVGSPTLTSNNFNPQSKYQYCFTDGGVASDPDKLGLRIRGGDERTFSSAPFNPTEPRAQ